MSEKANRRGSEDATESGSVAEGQSSYDVVSLAPDIASLVDGLAPIDWVQLRLVARLSPGQRIRSAMEARAFVVAGLKATFRSRFPELSDAELNMKVLAHVTTVRMPNRQGVRDEGEGSGR